MKKKIITAICFIFAGMIIILPIVPVGSSIVYVDLTTGNEIIQKSYLAGLFNFSQIEKTFLSDSWPDAEKKESKNKLIMISKVIIYPFGKRYINMKISRVYYQLKDYCIEHRSSNERKKKINSFILYCAECGDGCV